MDVRLTGPTLPANYCIGTNGLQDFVTLIFAQAYGTLDTTASIAKIIIGSTQPTADQEDYIWIRLNPVTTVFDKIYNFVNGKWVSPHPISTNSDERKIWAGSSADVYRLDGGVNDTVSDTTGPFWEIDTEMSGKFPLGVGTLAGGTVVEVNTTGGVDELTIARANLPAETLSVDIPIIGEATVGTSGAVVDDTYGSTPVSGSGNMVDGTTAVSSNRYNPKGQTEELGDGEALSIIPPYYVVYFLKRTGRKYYTPA
jgi:hypothetical protein